MMLRPPKKLDMLLGKLFREEQIYRIDHYLGKEMTQNMISFRFNNDLFEDLWDRHNIEKIEIKFHESIGVEARGDFYDGIGALRDVGQNHVLQLLALVTMDRPKRLEAEEVRKARANILKTLVVPNEKDAKKNTFRGQYQGYLNEEGVSKHSATETFFKTVAFLSSPRWEGVPIILSGGKKIESKKEVVVTFKHRTPCFCPNNNHYQNKIIFEIEPKEGISIDFWAKKPGLEFEMHKQKFYHLFRDARKKVQYIEEYEKLLLDCILGNQLLFVSTEEVHAMWKFIDPIISAWDGNKIKLTYYKGGSKSVLRESEKMIGKLKIL